MKWKLVGTILMFAILIFGLLFTLVFLNASFDQTSHLENQDCIEVNKVASFVYDLCYDAYSKNIFIDVKRGADTYRVTELQLSFFDSTDRNYVIKDTPKAGAMKSYQIASPKNPTNLDVTLGIIKDFSSPICETPRRIFVDYCPTRNGTVDVTINPLNGGNNNENIILASQPATAGSDILSENLVDKEAIWKTQCESQWECSDWETCYNGVQKRTCTDTAKCAIPTDAPPTNKQCGATCTENWDCTWSACEGGYTTPTCKDKNKCGTTNNIPGRLACGNEATTGSCTPAIICEAWSACEIDYDFLDLSGGSILDLKGEKRRTCTDSNSCIQTIQETTTCSASVDVYTKEFIKCGLAYRGIYNQLSGELIAQIRMGSQDDPSLDITLSGGETEQCDHCFDRIMNGDEEWIDCGGSCDACTKVYGPAYTERYQGNSLGGAQSLIASLINQQTKTTLHKLLTKKI